MVQVQLLAHNLRPYFMIHDQLVDNTKIKVHCVIRLRR